MALEKDIALFSARLDAAIAETLENDVAEAIKDEMSEHLESYEYKKSRGPFGGGVRDRRQFKEEVEQSGNTTILWVTNEAPFQGGYYGGESLAEAVESGNPKYNMPNPRPFIAPTQESMDKGVAEQVFNDGMAKRGFGGIGGAFSFS